MKQIERFEFQAMASLCEIAIGAMSRERARPIAERAIAEVGRIERKYSRFTSDSVVAQINRNASHAPVPVDAETRALLEYASRIHSMSGGLFDVTTGLFQQAWDFRAGKIADTSVLADLCPHVGWSRVTLDEEGVRFASDRMRLDFGGFGKEYAADRAADVLKQAEIRSGYVNLGGDVATIGVRPDGEPWAMGIRHPRLADTLLASIPIADAALATSGDYERYFERDGQRYCHILSPRTGQPVRYWQSISVIAPRAITAGATSTVAMLLEAEGIDFLRDTGLPFLAVGPSGEVLTHRSTSSQPGND